MHAPKPAVWFVGITFGLFAVGAAETARSFDSTSAKAAAQTAASILNNVPTFVDTFTSEHKASPAAKPAPGTPGAVADKTPPQ